MNDIKQLWTELRKLPLPANASANNVTNINPETLRAHASQIISAYLETDGLETDGALKSAQLAQLNDCVLKLKQLNPTLIGDAQVYFGKLYRICDLLKGKLA